MALIFILVLNKIKKPNKGSHIDYILLYLNEYYYIIIIFKYGYLLKNVLFYDFGNIFAVNNDAPESSYEDLEDEM